MKNLDLFNALAILNAHMGDDTQIVKLPRMEAENLKNIITKAMWDLRKQNIIDNIKKEYGDLYQEYLDFGIAEDDIVEIFDVGDMLW